MNIRGKLLTVSNDIIPTMDLKFQDYLSDELEVTFTGKYPEENENLVRIETLIPKIQIADKDFNIWSDEFQSLAEKNLPRKYLISLGYTHQFCFNAFCNYFEILSIGQFNDEAQNRFNEYLFYLEIQTKHDNKDFTIDYKRYWRELLQRLISVFETRSISFSNLFEIALHPQILNNLNKAIEFTPPREFI